MNEDAGSAAAWAGSYRHELSPVDFLQRAGDVYADRPAVVDGARRISYAEWRARAWRFAAALHRLGVGRGDRVAFLAPNCEELLLAHFAVPSAGGVLVALNTRLKAQEIADLVRHSGARLLFVDPRLADLTAAVEPAVQVVLTGQPLEELLAAESGARCGGPPKHEDELLSINYTSGTTGRPKGVMYTHRGATLTSLGLAIEFELSAQSRHLWLLPLFHCNGWCFPWALVAVGAAHVCMPAVDPRQAWRLMEEEGITHYAGAPVVHSTLLDDPAARVLTRRVIAASGGAAPAPMLISRLAEHNIQLRHIYGLTETYGPFTANTPRFQTAQPPLPGHSRLIARQGFPHVTGGRLRVVDQDMRDVPPDGTTLGEVVMRGNGVMAGYFQDAEASREAFLGGWFHSGDLAVRHPSGEIEIRDRSKDIVISGGENISTIEVEQTLLGHTAVAECAVIGVPDERWGEVCKAFVSLRTGAAATPEELKDYLREHLAHYKCPKYFEFGALPKNATGKIQKFQLRAREKDSSVQ